MSSFLKQAGFSKNRTTMYGCENYYAICAVIIGDMPTLVNYFLRIRYYYCYLLLNYN